MVAQLGHGLLLPYTIQFINHSAVRCFSIVKLTTEIKNWIPAILTNIVSRPALGPIQPHLIPGGGGSYVENDYDQSPAANGKFKDI
jgi:hypothetical protein